MSEGEGPRAVVAGSVGLTTAVAIVIGNMVGTGVFTSLGFQVGEIPRGFPLMALWLVGGVVSLCGALSYARLASLMPRSGGEYHFLGELVHPMAGFLAGWVSITVAFAAPVALSAMALAAYLGRLLPEGLSPRTVAVVAVLIPTLVHLWRIEAGSGLQVAFTGLKVLVVAVLAVAGLALGQVPGQEAGFFAPAPGDAALFLQPAFAVSLVYVMYAYSGWNAATYMLDEFRNPRRTVPIALVLGTLIVTVLYLSLNAAFLRSAPLNELEGELEVGLVAARRLFGTGGANAVAMAVGLGLVASISAMLWAGSRVADRVGQDLPALRLLARRTRRGVPAVALVVQCGIAMILLLTATFQPVLAATQTILLISSFATVAAVFVAERRQSAKCRERDEMRVDGRLVAVATSRDPAASEVDGDGGVPLWGYPVTPLLFLAVTGWMIIYVAVAEPWPTAAGVGVLALGVVVYRVLGGRGGATCDPVPAPALGSGGPVRPRGRRVAARRNSR